MIKIALDTSSDALSVAIEHQHKIYSSFEVAPRRHGELLLTRLQTLLKEYGLENEEVELVVFGKGPGAFTGVRIAVAAAQGLAFGYDCQVVGISTLQNLAYQAIHQHSAEVAAVAVDARMDEVYWGLYEKRGDKVCLMGEELVTRPETINQNIDLLGLIGDRKVVKVGTGWDAYVQQLTQSSHAIGEGPVFDLKPSAEAYLSLLKQGESLKVEPELAVPTYLRNNVAKKSTKKAF